MPSVETAQSGDYKPLSRPLIIYVKKESLDHPEVERFVDFTLDNAQEISDAARFVPPSDEQVAEAESALQGA